MASFSASSALLLALCALGPASAASQAVSPYTMPGDPLVDYARLLQLADSVPADPWSAAREVRASRLGKAPGLRFELLPAELRGAWNSRRPWGTNDGAIWQGRGATAAFTAGAAFRWGPLSGALHPTVIRNENRGFGLSPLAVPPGLGPWSYPSGIGQTLDMPQRFGDGLFDTFDLGQSFVRAEIGPLAVGLSNENRWWGPGRQNAITMTNNAPGFGHAFLETRRPLDLGIVTVEGEWVWGSLRESRHFDSNVENDRRFFTGITGRLSPKGMKDLELGFTRHFSLYWPAGGPSSDELLMVFIPMEKVDLITPENPTGDDAADQMASIFFRWKFPRSRTELYGEWGRGDHSRDLRDLLLEPEHASAWLVGLQRAFRVQDQKLWRLSAEFLTLGSARTSSLRAPASAFYVHHIVKQGYTQRGQVMGAGIGPGSSQLWLAVDRFAPWGKVGAAFMRTAYDNNRFLAQPRSFTALEVEPSFALDALVFRGPLDIQAGATFSRLLNKWYVEGNDETNVNVSIGARYHFGPGVR